MSVCEREREGEREGGREGVRVCERERESDRVQGREPRRFTIVWTSMHLLSPAAMAFGHCTLGCVSRGRSPGLMYAECNRSQPNDDETSRTVECGPRACSASRREPRCSRDPARLLAAATVIAKVRCTRELLRSLDVLALSLSFGSGHYMHDSARMTQPMPARSRTTRDTALTRLHRSARYLSHLNSLAAPAVNS